MTRSSATLAYSLVLMLAMFCCCCGGFTDGFDQAQLQNLFQGGLQQAIEQATEGDTAAPPPAEPDQPVSAEPPQTEPAESAEMTLQPEPAPTEEPAEATAPIADEAPAADLPAQEPPATAEEEAQQLLEALEDQLQNGEDTPFTFGCDNPDVPMPPDAEGCVSIAGFTSYSTAMSQAEINQMYSDYFTGKGWSQFSEMIQDDIINAWSDSKNQSFAMLSFIETGGENGKNMVSLGVLGE